MSRRFIDISMHLENDVQSDPPGLGPKISHIVVVNTRAGSAYGTSEYTRAGCGMGFDATMLLLEQGVRLTGTDAWSWDAPFAYTAQKYAQTADASLIWEGHKAGSRRSSPFASTPRRLPVRPTPCG